MDNHAEMTFLSPRGLWAMEPLALAGLSQKAFSRDALAGVAKLSQDDETELETWLDSRCRPFISVCVAEPDQPQSAGVAVVDIAGPIFPGSSVLTYLYGGSSMRKLLRLMRELGDRRDIGAIVLNVDSPGGSVDLVPEAAVAIRAAAKTTPVYAVASTWAASAAYWLASQASELSVTPSGEVGSIGVWSMHVDISGWLDQIGDKVTLISAGQYKMEGNPYEPLTEEAREEIQRGVDHCYDMFVAAVAKGRGKKAAVVRRDFGQGRMVRPQDAIEAGMVDRIETADELLARVVKDLAARQRGRRAAAERDAFLAAQEATLASESAPLLDSKTDQD